MLHHEGEPVNWYRVELDGSGAVTATECAGPSRVNTRHVRYVEAVDAAQACSEVLAWYAKRRRKANERESALRNQNRAAGLCSVVCCKSKPKTGRKQCSLHLKAKADSARRRYNGAPALIPKTSPEQILANVRKRTEDAKKITGGSCGTYARILGVFDKLGPVAFRAWLVSKIPVQQPEQAEAAE